MRTVHPALVEIQLITYGQPARGTGALAFLGTTASMIAFINSVVAGVGFALLGVAHVGGDHVAIGLICGVIAVASLMLAFLVCKPWRFNGIDVATRPMKV